MDENEREEDETGTELEERQEQQEEDEQEQELYNGLAPIIEVTEPTGNESMLLDTITPSRAITFVPLNRAEEPYSSGDSSYSEPPMRTPVATRCSVIYVSSSSSAASLSPTSLPESENGNKENTLSALNETLSANATGIVNAPSSTPYFVNEKTHLQLRNVNIVLKPLTLEDLNRYNNNIANVEANKNTTKTTAASASATEGRGVNTLVNGSLASVMMDSTQASTSSVTSRKRKKPVNQMEVSDTGRPKRSKAPVSLAESKLNMRLRRT